VSDRMKFGIFMAPFHTAEGQNPTLAFRRDLELIQHLDDLGYDEAWIGEHHTAAGEIISSPEIFCGWAAAQTSRIKFGTGVISLPYHNPLWVADRAILLDHLTRGRFMLGIGPGVLVTDATMIGLNPEELRTYLQEDFPVLMHLLRKGEPLTVETDRYRLVEAQVQLDPFSDFDIAVTSIFTPSGPLLAGRYGIGLLQLSGLTPEGMAILPHHWKVMESQSEKYGTTVSRDSWRVVGIMHIAETRDKAIDEVRFGLNDYFDYVQNVVGVEFYQTAGKTFEERLDWAIGTGNALIGTPDDAIEKIGELVDASAGGVGAFLFWAQEWASPENTKKNFELFARRVMPVFQGTTRQLDAARKWAAKNSGGLMSKQMDAAKRFIDAHADELPAPDVQPHHPGDQS
jgi:limonene 1,2-monooxygenase